MTKSSARIQAGAFRAKPAAQRNNPGTYQQLLGKLETRDIFPAPASRTTYHPRFLLLYLNVEPIYASRVSVSDRRTAACAVVFDDDVRERERECGTERQGRIGTTTSDKSAGGFGGTGSGTVRQIQVVRTASRNTCFEPAISIFHRGTRVGEEGGHAERDKSSGQEGFLRSSSRLARLVR